MFLYPSDFRVDNFHEVLILELGLYVNMEKKKK